MNSSPKGNLECPAFGGTKYQEKFQPPFGQAKVVDPASAGLDTPEQRVTCNIYPYQLIKTSLKGVRFLLLYHE